MTNVFCLIFARHEVPKANFSRKNVIRAMGWADLVSHNLSLFNSSSSELKKQLSLWIVGWSSGFEGLDVNCVWFSFGGFGSSLEEGLSFGSFGLCSIPPNFYLPGFVLPLIFDNICNFDRTFSSVILHQLSWFGTLSMTTI